MTFASAHESAILKKLQSLGFRFGLDAHYVRTESKFNVGAFKDVQASVFPIYKPYKPLDSKYENTKLYYLKQIRAALSEFGYESDGFVNGYNIFNSGDKFIALKLWSEFWFFEQQKTIEFHSSYAQPKHRGISVYETVKNLL